VPTASIDTPSAGAPSTVCLVLDSVRLAGFKSFRDCTVGLGRLNVLVGANGSGKSNLVQAFALLGHIVGERLQVEVERAGGASTMMHQGHQRAEQLQIEVRFGVNRYSAALAVAQGDGLFFESERVDYQGVGYPRPFNVSLSGGHRESGLRAEASSHAGGAAAWARATMQSWVVYHFHDTSRTASVKQKGPVGDDQRLRPDAGNLAAFLHRLQTSNPADYRRIVDAIRLVAPFFDDFDLHPDRANTGVIQLEWRQRGSDAYFNAHALSDGTLRFMCLATLLLQPSPPALLVIDEPELGLHPFAISQLAEMLQTIDRQIVISTQSVTLLNQLDLEDVLVVEQKHGESVVERLTSASVQMWLDRYSLGEMWEKNLIGGRPTQQ
jgi:predicted ATPase